MAHTCLHDPSPHSPQIRRKADPAKEGLQAFVKKWRDDSRVVGHPSHKEMLGEARVCVCV